MSIAGAAFDPLQTERARHCADCTMLRDCVFVHLPMQSPVTRQLLVRERRFKRGECLRAEGSSAETIQMVKVGSVLVRRTGVDGVARPIAILGRGQLLGKLEPLDMRNALSCEALSPGRVCEVQHRDLDQLLYERFRIQVLGRYAQILSLLADWAHAVRIRGVQGQVAATLVLLEKTQRSKLVQLPGHSVLADLLGTSRETVARALTRLETQNAIRRVDRQHCELDIPKLLASFAH